MLRLIPEMCMDRHRRRLRSSAATTDITVITGIIAGTTITVNVAAAAITSSSRNGVTMNGSQNWPASSLFPTNSRPR